MTTQIGIPYFKYSFQYGGGGGALEEHDHSTLEQGGAVPQTSITGHSKAIHDALAILHSSLTGIGIDNHHPKIHKTEHESGGGDAINHNALVNYLVSQHLTLPNTIAAILSNHSKAVHDALAIIPGAHKTIHELSGSDEVDHNILKNYLGVQHCTLPNSLSNVITNHDKAIHDSLGINAGTVDGKHLPSTVADIITNHNKALHTALGLIGGNIPSCRVRRIGDQSIPERSYTKIIWNSKEDGWDNLNNWSTVNSEFTVPAGHAGRYLCTLVLEFEEMGDDANNKIAGGVQTDRSGWQMQNMTIGRWLPVHEGIYSIVLAGIVDVVAGNKIWSMCEQYNDASENRNLSGDPRYSFFCIQKMVD